MNYVFEPAVQPSAAVSGVQDRFPIRRVFCVGRNYAAHAREMGHDPDRDAPFFFMKPADAVVPLGNVPYPPQTSDLHHEIELVVAINKAGVDIDESKALEHVYGYAVGIDLTRRDLQGDAKKKGRPWDWGKGFDNSAPMSAIVPLTDGTHPSDDARVWLSVNGQVRQDATLAELIWKTTEVISIISQSMALQPGDLIFTGTPAGVNAIVKGDVVTGGVDGVGTIEVTMT
jgi:fumarylpyruvate hydrolase